MAIGAGERLAEGSSPSSPIGLAWPGLGGVALAALFVAFLTAVTAVGLMGLRGWHPRPV